MTVWIFFFIISFSAGGLLATDIEVETRPIVYVKEYQDVQVPCGSNMLFSSTLVKWKFGTSLKNSTLLVWSDYGAVGGPQFKKGYDLLKNRSLLINNSTTRNSGVYFCVVEDSTGNTGYNKSQLVVHLRPVLSEMEINFCGANNPNCTREFQSNITLPLVCTARSERAAVRLEWKSNVSDISQRTHSVTEESDGIFSSYVQIKAQFYEAVKYVCSVRNTEEYSLPENSIFINISPLKLYPEEQTIGSSSGNKWTVPVTIVCTIVAIGVLLLIAGILYKKYSKKSLQSETFDSYQLGTDYLEVPDRDRVSMAADDADNGMAYADIYEEIDVDTAVQTCREDEQRSPEIEFETRMTIRAAAGEPVTLPCISTDTTNVVWLRLSKRGRKEILYIGKYKNATTEDFLIFNGNLTIMKPKKRNQGLYITGSIRIFQDNYLATAYELVCDKSCQQTNYRVALGSNVILPVDHSFGKEISTVTWSKDSYYGNLTEIGYSDKYTIQRNGNLLISQADSGDNGIFYCELDNKSTSYGVTVTST